MKNKLLMLFLCFALLSQCYALAEMEAPLYGIEGKDGSIFAVYVQSNDDLILEGTYFDHTGVDFQVDRSIARVNPAGEIVWVHHLPYVSEEGGTALVQLPKGQYLVGQHATSGSNTLFIFDADEGLIKESDVIDAGAFFQADDSIIGMEAKTGSNKVRLRWLDDDLIEEKQIIYKFDLVLGSAGFVKCSDGFIMVNTYEADEYTFILTKLNWDGEIIWQREYPSYWGRINYYQTDHHNGMYLMCDPGLYHTRSYVMRVDQDGDLLWTNNLDHGEAITHYTGSDVGGYHIQFETDDTIQFVTLTPSGEEIREPERKKPTADTPDTTYNVNGVFYTSDSKMYLYGDVRKIDYSEYYGMFVLPLDSFEKLE